MNISLSFIRIFFLIMSMLFLTTYMSNALPGGFNFTNVIIGLCSGLFVGFALIGIDLFLKRFNLRSFNLALLGLFLGCLMGQAITLAFNSIMTATGMTVTQEIMLVQTALLFVCVYVGMVMTVRSSEEIHLCIPFIKLNGSVQKKKDLLIDSSILLDSRIIDLASSGLLDDQLIMPQFALKDLQQQLDIGDDAAKSKARKCLDVFKKLEQVPGLELRFSETDFPEIKDQIAKLVQLARTLDTNIITADINRIQQSGIEGIRIINIHVLSNALKPLTHAGEFLNIKIQRYGKEPRQGVGYLEDGTMVVVNGGAEFIGDTIRAQVLSVKHTSSGRMIFCNATEDMAAADVDMELAEPSSESAHKNYFAL